MEIPHRSYLPQNQQVSRNYSQDSTFCPASCFTFNLQLPNRPLHNLWCLCMGKLCLDISKKDRKSTKTGPRLIYFSKSREHAVPFFLKSNCLPLPSLFFRDCSYILYDINRQTAPVSILNHFVKTSHIHNYRTRSVSSESFYVKFSRTDKMYAFFSRIGAQIWNSIPFSIKLLKRSSFRKKIKGIITKFLAV